MAAIVRARLAADLQRTVRHAQALGGALVAAAFLLQHDADGRVGTGLRDARQSYALVQRMADGAGECGVRPRRGQVRAAQGTFVRRHGAQRDGPGAAVPVPQARHRLAQLAHVAGVVAREQVLAHGWIEFAAGLRVGMGGQEVGDQRQDVVAPFAQGRRAAAPAGDAVQQVGAELAARHFLFQVAVGGAHQPEPARLPGVAAHPFVFLLLHHPQQLRLQGQGQFAYFVEKQHALVGLGKGAVARAHGARVRAPFVAEQFTAGQFRR